MVEAETAMTKIGDLKKLISAHLGGMPNSKFQVKADGAFLKDGLTLAHYNIGAGAKIEIKVKSRGGRR